MKADGAEPEWPCHGLRPGGVVQRVFIMAPMHCSALAVGWM
jgi:hypothetical protein